MIIRLLKLKSEYKELLIYFITIFAAFSIGMAIQIIGDESQQVSTILCLLITTIVNVFLMIFNVINEFRLCLQMGETRKSVYWTEFFIEIMKFLLLMSVGELSYLIQNKIYRTLGKEINLIECCISGYITMKNIFIIGCFSVVLTLLLAGIVVKFKTKGLFAVYVTYMIIVLFGGNLSDRPDSPIGKFIMRIIKALSGVSTGHMYMLGGIIALISLVISYILFSRSDL